MITSEKKKREQIQMFCIDDLVPKDHLLRKIEKAIDWSFIYELVKDKYSEDKGRPSIDAVTLIKIPMMQYLYGIRSMRQTIKEIEVIVLVDELITASSFKGTEPATHPHDWIDNNGQNDWDVWETYIQDKENTVWKAKLRIANSTNGEKILYDVFPIEKVGEVETIDTTPTHNSISQNSENVNTKFSVSDSVDNQSAEDVKVLEGGANSLPVANDVVEEFVRWHKNCYGNHDRLCKADLQYR